MRKVSVKLIVLLILAALVPMILYGIISIWASRKANYRSVSEGNLNVAKRAAEQMELYVVNSLNILRAISENINRINLLDWQKETILKNYVMNFDEFEEIYVTDMKGRQLVTTSVGNEPMDVSMELLFQEAMQERVYQSEIYISENFTPGMILALPIKRLNMTEGVIAARVNLMDMWNLVDGIKIGEEGYAMVVSKSGLLIAHGRPEAKIRILKQENLNAMEIVKSVLSGKSRTLVYRDPSGEEVLGVCAPIKALGWGVIIEQPTKEAYRLARQMTRELLILTGFFLLLMMTIGYLGGRWQIVRPISKLMEGTKAISRGDLDQKVEIPTRDEFSELGNAFNQMTGRLKELQEEIRLNERSVTFGKVAAGLAHDLKQPLNNLELNSNLIMKLYNDEGYRESFSSTIKRELAYIKRIINDLHNLTHPTPLSLIELDVHKVLDEVIDGYREEARQNNIGITKEFFRDELRISADLFALERVLKNLILNAVQAMPKGGEIRIGTNLSSPSGNGLDLATDGSWGQWKIAEISIMDTGCGIPKDRLKDIFVDYTTTKKRGLGLGLAISKKLTEELGGSIEVESEVGKGTIFTLKFPLVET